MSERRTVSPIAASIAGALSLVAAVGVPLFFFGSSWIAGQLERAFHLRVESSLSGGEIAAEFADPIGDDAGPGGYEYPLGCAWERGELDIVRYVVRKPVTRPVWGPSGAYWQLEAVFAKAFPADAPGAGFRAPALHIYIDIDGKASGSTESAFGEGELLRFDPGHPWDYVVAAQGQTGRAELRSSDGSYRASVWTSWDLKRRRLTLRIDLAKAPALLASAASGRPTWHYVLVGADDPAREGGFAALRKEPGLHDGGGAKDELSPRVFDLIASPPWKQVEELSSEDAARGIPALVHPVAVGDGSRPVVDPGLRERLLAEASKEAAAAAIERRRKLADLPPPSSKDASMIGELFGLGLDERCLEAIRSRLAARPGDPVALAYRGALVAKSADRAFGPGEKMRLVAEAYRDLDAAVAASGTGGAVDRMAILVCRGAVSSAVPNDVFGRAAQGAADLCAASEQAAESGDAPFAARCLADAAEAFEKAGLPDEAATRWATLGASPGPLAPDLELSLLDRAGTNP